MRILALNGGGSLGYITATFLRDLEQDLGLPLWEYFDMVTGVSTGSLISAAIANKKTGDEIVKFYEEGIPKIFGNSRSWFMRLWKPKYDNEELIKIVSDTFGDLKISDAATKLSVHATKLTDGDVRPKFWKSWEDDILVKDAVLASSAAPTYFPNYVIDGVHYVDGAFSTNNLSMCAVADALKLGHNPNDIKVLNIACLGRWGYTREEAKKKEGILDWVASVYAVASHASEPMAVYQAQQIIGKDRFMLIQSDCFKKIDETDMNSLKSEAVKLVPQLTPTVDFFRRLT